MPLQHSDRVPCSCAPPRAETNHGHISGAHGAGGRPPRCADQMARELHRKRARAPDSRGESACHVLAYGAFQMKHRGASVAKHRGASVVKHRGVPTAFHQRSVL